MLKPRSMFALLFSSALVACGGSESTETPAGSPQNTAGNTGKSGAGGAAASSGASTGGAAGKAGASTGGNAGAAGKAAAGAGGGGAAGAAGAGGASGASGVGGTAGAAGGGNAGASGASGTAGAAGASGSAGVAGSAAGQAGAGAGGAGGSAGVAGASGKAGAGGAPNLCSGVVCPGDQTCKIVAGSPTCVDLTCADLMCKANEACEDPPTGGARCLPTCASDLDCPIAQFCGNPFCVDDVCKPNETKCQGDKVLTCLPNGSAFVDKVTCGSSTWTGPACIDANDGKAHCGCFDDWDCPAYMSCTAGVCEGTGKAPTCSLPPVPFAKALPKSEIQWGGTGSGATAHQAAGRPFPLSSQVSATPMVANLDDDNGDGLIDERDIPEIIFMTYCGTDVSANGIIRAIHGGGPAKGKDLFASCGGTVWHEGDDPAMACPCSTAIGNSTSALAVGDLDNDGKPEIVVPNETAGVTILDNRGVIVAQSAPNQWAGYVDPAVSIANVDNAGFAEIIVGRHVFTLGKDTTGKLVFVDRFSGSLMDGKNGQGPISCVADLDGNGTQEIVAGTTAYRFPTPPPGVTKIADCAVGATDDYCTGKLAVLWDGQTVNGAPAIPTARRDGFCAVADVLGADEVADPSPANPLDGKPEVVLIAEGYLLVLNGATGTLRRSIDLGAGADGGAPNVDDFDGDGFPEIGTAFGSAYIMIDLQSPTAACPAWPNVFNDAMSGQQGNPARTAGGACTKDSDCAAGTVCNETIGSCVCLHNGWRRLTEDDSSRVTGSSVFDFNGDGAAEVIYGDECYLRIYDGTSGKVLFKTPAVSRTRIENPVVADVDNDGNAEIVHATNNDANACSSGNNFPNGISVLGDASDAWVSARRIWNQHAYHITNVNESGQIPTKEPASWGVYNGRTYDTYRSNPRNYGVAPDLTISAVQVSSPDVTCGQLSSKLTITVSITNQGDVRVGAGIPVTFYGQWGAQSSPLYADAAQTPLTTTLPSTLEPGSTIILQVAYDATHNAPGTLPDTVRIVVDEADLERECVESNNQATTAVSAGSLSPDMTLVVGAPKGVACPSATIPTTVFNVGSAAASNVLVRYYAGDPDQGGTPLHDEVFAGPFAPGGGSVTRDVVLTTLPTLAVLIYARVDPNGSIAECNEGNNTAATSVKVDCSKF